MSEWWEVRSTSWWEHGRTRRRGSTHCVSVVVDGDTGSLRWNWDACERRQPIAELMDVLQPLFVPLMVLLSATVWLLASVHVHCSRCLVEQAVLTTKTSDVLSRNTG